MQNVLYILEELNDDDIDWMVACGCTEEIPTNALLIHQGEQVDALYVVLNGTFVVSVATGEGRDREIARLSTGDVVGEMSFVDTHPPSATVTATSNSLVLSISRQELTTKLQLDVGFSSRFHRALVLLLSSRLRLMMSQLGDASPQFETATRDDLSIAKVRFDWLLRRLRGG
jgi:CRP/FNR family transcriptional regulator, cyclic AMP receptor protein